MSFSKISDDPPAELVDNIRRILEEYDSSDARYSSEDAWRWRYRLLPSGDARVYVCKADDRLCGYYHAPIYRGIVSAREKKFAMVQEVAVSSLMRGRGVFRQLAEYATQDLLNSDVDLIYTFPNARSIHTFLKYNHYSQIRTLDAFLLPLRSADIIRCKLKLAGLEYFAGFLADRWYRRKRAKLEADSTVTRLPDIGADVEAVFREFTSQYEVSLERSAAYLKWRYVNNPNGQYSVFALCRNDVTIAVAVFKADRILGVNALLLMDFAHLKGQDDQLVMLIDELTGSSAEYFADQPSLVFTAGNNRFFARLRSLGFVRVPEKFNPRPLNLLIKSAKTSEDTLLDPKNWNVTLTDWDVF